jgi:hypothetical protein
MKSQLGKAMDILGLICAAPLVNGVLVYWCISDILVTLSISIETASLTFSDFSSQCVISYGILKKTWSRNREAEVGIKGCQNRERSPYAINKKR